MFAGFLEGDKWLVSLWNSMFFIHIFIFHVIPCCFIYGRCFGKGFNGNYRKWTPGAFWNLPGGFVNRTTAPGPGKTRRNIYHKTLLNGCFFSKNRRILPPKWMVVYNGKPLWTNGWFGGTIIFGNTQMNAISINSTNIQIQIIRTSTRTQKMMASGKRFFHVFPGFSYLFLHRWQVMRVCNEPTMAALASLWRDMKCLAPQWLVWLLG